MEAGSVKSYSFSSVRKSREKEKFIVLTTYLSTTERYSARFYFFPRSGSGNFFSSAERLYRKEDVKI